MQEQGGEAVKQEVEAVEMTKQHVPSPFQGTAGDFPVPVSDSYWYQEYEAVKQKEQGGSKQIWVQKQGMK